MLRVRLTSKAFLPFALAAVLLAGPAANAGYLPSNMTATKTVGILPPPNCGATSSIVVPTGATVYFCYTLLNNSGANVTYSLVDNVLGLVAANRTVTPGTTDRQFMPWSVYSNATSVPVVNVASWKVAPSGAEFSSASASVTASDQVNVPSLAPAGLLALGGALLLAGLLFLRRIG